MFHHKQFENEAKDTKKWRCILSNIEMYDGTERGQNDIDEK